MNTLFIWMNILGVSRVQEGCKNFEGRLFRSLIEEFLM